MKILSFFCFILAIFLLIGCSEGTEAPRAYVGDSSYLSPVLSDLSISGDKISRATGGILKLSCQWTAASSVGSASAYVQFVEDVNNPVNGPTGVISSTTMNASGTTATLTTKIFKISPYHLEQISAATSSGTTATTTASASSTTTVTTPSLPWYYGTITNPMVIPTGIATTKQSGYWSVEIPFPSSIVGQATLGTQQMLLWMVLNDRKTNTLAFEIQFTE